MATWESPREPRYAAEFPPLVHHAAGVLMASFRIDPDAALTWLAIRAVQREISVTELAQLLVERPNHVEELMGHQDALRN